MRRILYSLIAILTMGFGAYAQGDVPTQIQVYGSSATSVNGTQCSWTEGQQVSVDVVDGTAVLNFQNPTGSFTISTCAKEETNWNNINGSRLAIPSTAIDAYLQEQGVTSGANVSFASEEKGKNVTVVFSDNLTKVTILPGTLYCAGAPQTAINGKNIAWDLKTAAVEVTAENGYFNLEADWNGSLYITYYFPSLNNWGKGIIGEGYEVYFNRTTFSAELLNKPLAVELNNKNPQPPFPAETPYIIKISQDLKTIEYDYTRSFQVEVRDGYYDQVPAFYDMETTDGVTYTCKFAENIPAERTVTIVDKNHKENQWRMNGDIAFGTEQNWGTGGGTTPSTLKNPFKGTVTAVMPSVMQYYGAEGNQYSGQTAAVTFTADTQTGGIGGVDVEAAEVEYFNLQGVRVDKPQNGIFIRRQGAKVSKVIVK